MAVVVCLSRAVRHKSNARAIRRPLRVRVVPFLTAGDLAPLSRCNIHDPQVPPFSIVPTGIIALINGVRIVADVTLVVCGRNVLVGGRCVADNDSSSIRRPLISFNSILKICQRRRLAAAPNRQEIDLYLRFVCGRRVQIACRGHRECFSVGTPSRHAGTDSFCTQLPRWISTFDCKGPYCGFPPILLLIDGGYNVSNYLSVRRETRIAYKLKGQIVFWRNAALGLGFYFVLPNHAEKK